MSGELEPNDDQRIQRHVLKHIGKKNAREMAAELGVSPEEILRAKREIVESVDEISIQVQKMRLLTTLQELAYDAQERSRSISSEFFAGTVNASVGAIKTLLVELNRTSKQDSEAVMRLNELRTREILRLIDSAVSKTFQDISDEHDIDTSELMAMFQSRLAEQAAVMENGNG